MVLDSRRRLVLLILTLVVALLTSSCSNVTKPQPQSSQPPTQTQQPAQPPEKNVIKIGAAISITGGLSREGNDIKKGYDLWKDFVNGKGGIQVGDKKYQVEIVFYDDKSDAQTSAKLTEKLITEDKVNFLLGPYSSGVTNATSSIGEKYKVITMASGANAPPLYERGYKYLFGILPLATKNMANIVNCLASQDPKPKSIAVLTPDDLFPVYAAKGVEDRAKSLGLNVVYSERYPRDTKDFAAILTQIKSKKPDLFFTTAYFEQLVTIIKQMKEMKLDVLGMAGMGTEVPDFVNTLGKAADYVFAGEYWAPNLKLSDPIFGSVENYIKLFKEKFNEEPVNDSVYASATCVALQTALQKAGTLDTEKVRQALLSLDIETVFTPLKYGENGINEKGEALVNQLQDGKVVYVYPDYVAQAKIRYPTPPWESR